MRGSRDTGSWDTGSWDGAVVVFAGSAWDGIPVSEKQLAEQLCAFAPVLYVDPPVSVTGRLRGRDVPGRTRLQLLGPRLARLTPVLLPGHNRPLLRTLSPPLLRRSAEAALRRLGGSARVVVAASLDDVLTAFPGALRVFYGTDDFVAGADLMGIDADWLRRREQAQLAAADLVVAVSEVLAERWAGPGHETVTIPNGVPETAAAPPASDVHLSGPAAVVIGRLSERIDPALLAAVVDRGCPLLLVGPVRPSFAPRLAPLLARPGVQWVGECPPAAIAGYLACAGVGLTPYTDTDFNRASFPLKTLEYLAAGLPVVSSDLPSVRLIGGDLVTVAAEPAAFADAVVAALAAPGSAERSSARRALAATHGWDVRARSFARACGLAEVVREHA